MTTSPPTQATNPWPALWALVIGFFMILVDSTIVSVAMPDIQRAFDADYNTVIWVTSAYLLSYAVPLLITGRLGDRFGPKRVYLVGLAVFTASSLWCGLTGSIEGLIAARVVQGLGASMMTPQTMTVITRTFPPTSRGKAMALWGATAGVATLVGPVLGGLLTASAGWEWIFIINVPVGIVGFVLAVRWVPALETHAHRFDWLGVALSAVAMFAIVYGIQEHGPWWLVGGGLVVFAVFLRWQAINRAEPLLPLGLFADRNFMVSNVAIAMVSFAVTSLAFPAMLWAQNVRGMSPIEAGLLFIPMAIASVVFAPIVGRRTDVVAPRVLTSFGFASAAACLVGLWAIVQLDGSLVWVLLALGGFGIGSAFLWAPIGATATRNLPMSAAGAGSGVYNATRQVGAVLGSAAIAAAIEWRVAARPETIEGLGQGLADSLLIPAAALVAGLALAQLYRPSQ